MTFVFIWLLIIFFTMAHFSSSHDVQLEDIVSQPLKLPLVAAVLKIGHVAHKKSSEATWRNYASARAFLEIFDVERLNIWVSEGEQLPVSCGDALRISQI